MEKLLGYGWGIAVRGLRLVIKANNTVNNGWASAQDATRVKA